MAFVFRSEKETTPVKADSNLGPGSYVGLSKHLFIHGLFLLGYRICLSFNLD
jgi:hypothetical protein